MGADPMSQAFIWSSIINGGTGLLSGMMSDPSGQERKSFEGTGADPVEWLSDARGSVGSLLRGATARLNEPIDLSASLPMSPAAVSTGFPPRTVGGFPANNGTPNRVKVDGFGIDPMSVGTGARDASDLRGAARRNTRNPNQVDDPDAMIDSPTSQIMRRPSNYPTANDISGPDMKRGWNRIENGALSQMPQQPGLTTSDPSAVGAAKLFLHSVFSQQGPTQPNTAQRRA
jgi:hypothetical protein